MNSSVCAGSRAATTVSWCGEKRQTGSVAAASPVRRSAWQRQPPQSSSWRPSGHERHGSCIQPVPRKRVNASDSCQIQSSERSRTFGKVEAGDRRGGLARERLAVRRDDDRGPPPAAHARLRQVLVVVREHPEDGDPRADALAEALHRLLAALELRARRHERPLVERRPTRSTACSRARAAARRAPPRAEDLLDPVEVLAVQDAVDREREAQLARRARGRDLLLERADAGDPVVLLGIRALDRDLDVVEPGLLQLRGALARQERARGHERRVQAGRAPGGHELVEVAAQHRLAAGQRELERRPAPAPRRRRASSAPSRARRGSGRRRCRRDSSSTGSAAGTGRRAPRRACRA